MKRVILVSLIAVICVIIILGLIGCLRPILPGSSVEIIYPANGAVVPTDFSVVGVGTSWSFGVEVERLLFLSPPESYVRLRSAPVELSIDGVTVADGEGGNHHVFRISAAPGDHTLVLSAPFGESRITVHATDNPPILFEPFGRAQEYAEATDDLERALSEYAKGYQPSSAEDIQAGMPQGVYPADGGAFILFGGTEVRYIDASRQPPTADDIAAAPVVFSFNRDQWGRPVKITAVESGGDRLYVAVLDDETLTLFSVFPDGAIRQDTLPLAKITPGLAEALAITPYPQVRTRANRGSFFVHLDTYREDSTPTPFDLLVDEGSARPVDLGGKDVDGITPDGGLITIYPAPFTGPFDSALIDNKGKTSVGFPLPATDKAFSFTGGSVHDINRFYPERPSFEFSPVVPCVGCTVEYFPLHHGVAGQVAFGPGVLKSSIGGREEYFVMRPHQ